MSHRLFRRHVALPADHGSWVFLLSPLLIGLFAGGRWSIVTLYLVVASLAAFLARQPLTIIVKILSGRRGRDDLVSALFWTSVYGGIAALHVTGLVLRGFGWRGLNPPSRYPNHNQSEPGGQDRKPAVLHSWAPLRGGKTPEKS